MTTPSLVPRRVPAGPQLCAVTSKTSEADYVTITMSDEQEKGKAEKAAEKTGELVGKGAKKGFGVVKGLGKGFKDAVTEKKEEKKE